MNSHFFHKIKNQKIFAYKMKNKIDVYNFSITKTKKKILRISHILIISVCNNSGYLIRETESKDVLHEMLAIAILLILLLLFF